MIKEKHINAQCSPNFEKWMKTLNYGSIYFWDPWEQEPVLAQNNTRNYFPFFSSNFSTATTGQKLENIESTYILLGELLRSTYDSRSSKSTKFARYKIKRIEKRKTEREVCCKNELSKIRNFNSLFKY